ISLSGPIAGALADMGYAEPSPVQQQAIPHALAGKDIVAQAETGSGKTAAFGIPICERVEIGGRDIQAIVLTPTRELAMQVADELTRIGQRRGVRVAAVYGGQPIKRQLDQLSRGVDVVVGTPGRVIDHMKRSSIQLGSVKIAVLDEADEMLDIGFADDMEYILRRTPKARQTFLFSATIPGFVRRLIRKYQDDPVWVRLGAEIQTVESVEQFYYEVAEQDKERAIREVLAELEEGSRVLVFRRMQVGVDRLVRALKNDYPVLGLHGGMSQGERNEAMRRFKSGQTPILISTNVAARGIDVPEISHVINFDMPDNVEEYVHRIGRTARMGRKGVAISFLAEWDLEVWDKIAQHVGSERLQARTLGIYAR
ncbi:MAG: DEAD/DEAH box helicase, partial [Chloroflexota bacterium]